MPELIIHEEWKEIDGWSAYRISTYGKVESRWVRFNIGYNQGCGMRLGDKWNPIKTQLAGGRLIVTLGTGRSGEQKTFGVAHLVLTTFVRPPNDGEIARHYVDPNPSNCYVGNLRWGTRFDNMKDIVRHDGKYHSSKLTPQEVTEIRAELAKDPKVPGRRRMNNPCKALAAKYGVSWATIRYIERGIVQKLVD